MTTETYPGVVADVPDATRGFVLNDTMVRVKDPAASLAFYTGVLGMRVRQNYDAGDAGVRNSLQFCCCAALRSVLLRAAGEPPGRRPPG